MYDSSGGTPEQRHAEAKDLLKIIQDAEIKLDKDKRFISGIRARFVRFGLETRIAPTELFWLRDVKDRQL